VDQARNAEYEVSRAQFPAMRLFQVKRTIAMEPAKDVEVDIPWSECSPEVVPTFSAVGYFFGRELYQTYHIPIGLIHTSWGGTPAEAWTSPVSLRDYPVFQPILDRFAESLPGYDQKYAAWEKELAAWQKTAERLRAEGKDPGRAPGMPYGPKNPHAPSGLYNGMINGLIPYAVTGAIWYQGESNAGRAYQYRRLFSTMIRSWRDAWGQGDFPFLFVQLANYQERKSEPVMEEWAELREAQVHALQLPNVGMAVTIDLGEADNIHPRNKQEVGRRLALAAREIAYGEDVVHSGPMYHDMTVQNSTIRLRFTSTGSGLTALDGPLTGFAVAGIDRVFHWADAVIDRDAVVLSCPQVPHPVAARYAWANNPACNLYNREGLPASPFRTDDWKGNTADKQ
jgi:sialate O-acetylesterase